MPSNKRFAQGITNQGGGRDVWSYRGTRADSSPLSIPHPGRFPENGYRSTFDERDSRIAHWGRGSCESGPSRGPVLRGGEGREPSSPTPHLPDGEGEGTVQRLNPGLPSKREMRLAELTVQNFRIVKDLRLEGLGGFNVFIGPNASGKSTALEAIRLLLEENEFDLSRDDGFRGAPGEVVRIEGLAAFSRQDLNSVLPEPAPPELQGWGGSSRDDILTRLADLVGQVQFLYNGLPPSRPTGSTFMQKFWRVVDGVDLRGDLLKGLIVSELDQQFAARLVNHFVPTLTDFPRTRTAAFHASRSIPSSFMVAEVERPSPDEMGPWLVSMKGEDRPEFEQYRTLLGEFLPHVRGVLTSPTATDQLRLGLSEDPLGGMTPAHLWSSGTTHLSLLVSGLAFLPEGSVVIIEEPELGLHPYAIRQMMTRVREAAEKGGLQVFLSTHSPFVVEELEPETRDHTLWEFSRAEDGSAEATRRETDKEVDQAVSSLLVSGAS